MINIPKETYKNILEKIHDDIIIIDYDLNILFSNINSKKNTINLDTKNLKNILSNSSVNKFKNRLNKFKNKKIQFNIDCLNKTSYRVSIIKINNFNSDYIICVIDNITEIQKNEKIKNCIYKISESIYETNDLQSLYKEIHLSLSEVINTNNFYISFADWENQTLSFPYYVDEKDENPNKRSFENGLTEYVIKKDESLLLNDLSNNDLIVKNKIKIKGTIAQNWLGVPLKLPNGKIMGMICSQSYNTKDRFNDDDKDIFQYVSNQIALAIKRKKEDINIHKQAHYDQLTGLTNKGLFYDRLDLALHHAKRQDEVIAIMFLDIDDFKFINDNYGHNIGDKLLKDIGTRIKDTVRKGDTVCRWGGDEFTFMLPSINNIDGIFSLCKRLLKNKMNDFIIDQNKISITASIGIALFPQHGKTADKLINCADKAMYKAKKGGKNNYYLFGS